MEKQQQVQLSALSVEKTNQAAPPGPTWKHSAPQTHGSEPLAEKGSLADSLEMWAVPPDAEDSVVKPSSRKEPEPHQTPATLALKNQMVTQNRTPQSLCHQNPQAKPGPWHLQTPNVQHVTGSKVF
uniref:Uncharacterized protein n=1 Tax=Rhinolophus ferrumequinum TaxID=59479 RepID=A0A671DR88_RHIFE